MISYDAPENHVSCIYKNCTIASTFEKPNSLKFEILFGDYKSRLVRESGNNEIINAVDYFFSPGAIFGFACQSFGIDFLSFHHVFILRACLPGEIGSIITGVSPGAEILVKTLTAASSMRLRSILVMLQKKNIDLSKLLNHHYRKINYLLEAKINASYFVGELLEQKNWQ